MVFNDGLSGLGGVSPLPFAMQNTGYDDIDDFAYVYFPDALIMPSPTTGAQHSFVGDSTIDGPTTWSETTFIVPETWSWTDGISPTSSGGEWAAGGNNSITFTDSTQPGASFWMQVEYWDAVNIMSVRDEELDNIIGSPGLHSVKGPLFQNRTASILPEGIFGRLSQHVFWHAQGSSRSARLVAMRQPQNAEPPKQAEGDTAKTEKPETEDSPSEDNSTETVRVF